MTVVPGTGWAQVPLAVTTDLRHGGRWTSLRTGAGREWLWRHPDPAVQRRRARVSPGDGFVDAGGLEECLPQVRGVPDHGDVWSRPWQDEGGGTTSVRAGDLTLRRHLGTDGPGLRVRWRVSGPPGLELTHAAHALLQVGGTAVLVVDDGPARLLDGAGTGRDTDLSWPWHPDGRRLDVMGPVDGTAACVLLPGRREACVVDGDDALRLCWSADPADPADPAGSEDPSALLLWRNLGGWPVAAPYRSIGVEPMWGAAVEPGRGRPARIGPSGSSTWSLRLQAWSRLSAPAGAS